MFSPSAAQLSEVTAVLRAAGCVFAEDEARLLTEAAGSSAELRALAASRARGLPLEQVVGFAEFCGLRIAVAPGVFVPRRRTEFLARLAIAAAPREAVVLDMCCGTGAVAAAVAAAAPRARVYAADIDPGVVDCARGNLEPLGAQVFCGDLFEPLPPGLRGRVDVLTANAPYVPTAAIATLPPEARDHEPRTALDGGPDGLAIQRRVARAARHWLAPAGVLLIETSRRQAPATLAAVSRAGLTARVEEDDELAATVVAGTR